MSSAAPTPAAAPGLLRKLLLGTLLAVLLLALGLGLLEGGLRLAGVGHPPGFFRRTTAADGSSWIRENRWVTAPYFAPELLRRPQAFRLPAGKAPGTYRIFVLGSSAAMGDPEPAFSLARVLDALLRQAYPEIRFEVVNAGITAINSHVVRGIAADCAGLQPDLFIVYEGNNEVIGPFGPGTVFTPVLGSGPAVRAAIALRRTRTGQLVTQAVRPRRDATAGWGGMTMFLEHGITADDPRLATTRELFRSNLAAIADSGRGAGATVLLCTVLTNQRDFAPFLSRHRPGLDDANLAAWQRSFDDANHAAARGNTAAAEQAFRAALAIDDQFAELHFQLGRVQLARRDLAAARRSFQRALDLDVLRFRTDSSLNDVIRSLGAAPGVQVVDLVAAAEAASTDGLVGDDLLYEHVHLNFAGTYLAARRLCDAVTADLKARQRLAPDAPPPVYPELAAVRQALAYTTYEQAMIIRELLDRYARPPFTQQSDQAARIAHLRPREETALRLLADPDRRTALGILYEQAVAARPDDWMLRRNTGMAYVSLGWADRALPHLRQAAAVIDDDPDTLFALAQAHRALGHETETAEHLARLRALEPRYPGLPPATVR